MENVTTVLKLIIWSFSLTTFNCNPTNVPTDDGLSVKIGIVWFCFFFLCKSFWNVVVKTKLISNIDTQNPLNLKQEKPYNEYKNPIKKQWLFEITYNCKEFVQVCVGNCISYLPVSDFSIELQVVSSNIVACKVIKLLSKMFILKIILEIRSSSFIAIIDHFQIYIHLRIISSLNKSEIIDVNILPLRKNQATILEFSGPNNLQKIMTGNEVIFKIIIVQQHCDNNWFIAVRFCGSIPNLS